jgi:hypothetical protein
MNKYIAAIFYFLINFDVYCQALLSDNIGGVLKQLSIRREDCYEELIVEKVLPYSNDRSVIVIPKIVEQGEGYSVLDGYIANPDELCNFGGDK